MRKILAAAVVSGGLLLSAASPALASPGDQTHSEYVHHKKRNKTLKRVGIGAGGGAVVGGLIGGGKGAGIGALAGGGTGYLYNRHRNRSGH